MAKEKETPEQRAIVKKVFTANRDANANDVKALPEWKKKFGDSQPGGRLLGVVRDELGIPKPEKKSTGSKKAAVISTTPTADDVLTALALVKEHFGGDENKAKAALVAIEALGSAAHFKAALDYAPKFKAYFFPTKALKMTGT